MAAVVPFRGILYNPEKIQSLADVVTPPYDVISPQAQAAYYLRHPNSMVRLILGKKFENDASTQNPHTRAAEYYQSWLASDILRRDERTALYLTATDFTVEEKPASRLGLIARVGLAAFEKKIVLPHEKTFSRIKFERLELMKHCHANFSPVFALYPDENGIQAKLAEYAGSFSPDIDFMDGENQRHRMWRITDPSMHQWIETAMQPGRLFIADGHHRYETALNYQNWVSRTDSTFSADHPANFVMMYLCSMQDPGLRILPTHRLLSGMNATQKSALISEADKYCDMVPIAVEGNDAGKVEKRLEREMRTHGSEHALGICIRSSNVFYALRLKPRIIDTIFEPSMPEALRNLDVMILSRLFLENILGLTPADFDNPERISYTSSRSDAIQRVLDGRCDAAFLLNPTRIDQVQQIAMEGLTMPRKSTYFYPKAISGLVIHPLKRM